MTGTLFLIVGPSGVGKDTLLDGARAELGGSAWFRFVRRVITRPTDAGGEDHEPATEDAFATRLAAGDFLHHWDAHGLRYGVPRDVADDLARGVNVVLNTSRNELAALADKCARVVTIYVTASPDAVCARLERRGRESAEEIKKRLARIADAPHPEGDALELRNDGAVSDGIATLVDMIAGSCAPAARLHAFRVTFGAHPVCVLNRAHPVATRVLSGSDRVAVSAEGRMVVADLGWTDDDGICDADDCALSEGARAKLGAAPDARVTIERSPTPKSRAILQKKIGGGSLDAVEMSVFVDDMVNGRFSTAEIAGFLVSASTNLSTDEVASLARARAEYLDHQVWDADVVVDKHSMGGIPGNRITPIIIPIVAAFGLTMPKTSSRAITSAAGTADVMEVLARVDLAREDMARVVRDTSGCIAWNGRLTHSPVDDVMNAINRPLGLKSALLDVSSIMSKKLAAGSTHVLVDLPVGPQAKTRTEREARALGALFEAVGSALGLSVRVALADGTRPIGRGIGPVLEAHDVLAVLDGEADAPADLLDKALDYSATILEWAGGVASGEGQAVAREIVASGRARAKLDEIVRAQSGGEPPPLPAPGRFTAEIGATRAGTLVAWDIAAIAGAARAAGAPRDAAAGVVLLAREGDTLDPGQPILRLYASSRAALGDAGARIAAAPPVLRWS